jgi:arylsulfatase
VIWISDNANGNSQTMPQGFIGSNNGPFRGELGDALEGSLRVPGMIKWPGKIPAGKNNGMVSILDFFPTLANIIGAKMPTDRPIDGVDQSDFFMGKQESSNREHLMTFVNNELAGVRWRQYRMYPKPFVATFGNPSMQGAMGNRVIGNELMNIYDIKRDPREEICITADNAWVYRQYLGVIMKYKKSLETHPNPPGVSLSKPGF